MSERRHGSGPLKERHIPELIRQIGFADDEIKTLKSQLAARDAELATARGSLATACENLRLENRRAEDYRRKYESACAAIEGLRRALEHIGAADAQFTSYADSRALAREALAASREPEPAARGKTSEDDVGAAMRAFERARREEPGASSDAEETSRMSAPAPVRLPGEKAADAGAHVRDTSSDAEEVAREWMTQLCGSSTPDCPNHRVASASILDEPDDDGCDCLSSLAALLTRDRERVRRETWAEACEALHTQSDTIAKYFASWLAARGPKGDK